MRTPSLHRVDIACLGVLGLAWLAMVALANPVGDFPLNDDWVYGLAVKSILEQGGFRLPSANANVIAQAYWGALFCLPFGFSFTALRISTLVLGLLGVWATYGIAREQGAGARVAALGSALVAGNPLFFALANSFMTDVPFFAVSAASLYFFVRWTSRPNPRDALIGLALAMTVILIRQAGIVIPLAFAFAYVVKRGMRPATIAVAAIPVAAGVALHFGFQTWLHATGRTPPVAEPPLAAMIAENLRFPLRIPLRLFIFCAYVGLFTLPLLAVVSTPIWRRSDSAQRRRLVAIFGVAVVASVVAVVAIGRPMPFIDNVLNAFGAGPLTLNDTFFLNANLPEVPPWLNTFWLAATLAAILGTALFACLIAEGVRRFRERPRPSGSVPAMIVIVGSGLAYTLLGALALKFFYDRYIVFLLLPAVLFVVSVAASEPLAGLSKRGIGVVVVVLTLQAAFSVVATRDYLEWNRLRWTATAALMADGIPRTSIDGGYEFNGWLGYDPSYQRSQGKSPWWVTDDEYVIASGPMRGFAVHRSYPFTRLLTGQSSRVLVLRRDRP